MTPLEILIFDRVIKRLQLEEIHILEYFHKESKKGFAERKIAIERLAAFHDYWVKNITSKIDKTNTEIKPNMFDDVDELAYRKPWGRMLDTHKIIKLRQYLVTKGCDPAVISEKLDAIFDLLKRKKLRVKDIIYDANIMEVTAVENLPKGILDEESSDEDSSDNDSDSSDKEESSDDESSDD
jgi:hypothetical protein